MTNSLKFRLDVIKRIWDKLDDQLEELQDNEDVSSEPHRTWCNNLVEEIEVIKELRANLIDSHK